MKVVCKHCEHPVDEHDLTSCTHMHHYETHTFLCPCRIPRNALLEIQETA